MLSLGQRTRAARMVTRIVDNPQGQARPTSSWPRPRSFRGRKLRQCCALRPDSGNSDCWPVCAITCCQCRRRHRDKHLPIGSSTGRSPRFDRSLCLLYVPGQRVAILTSPLHELTGVYLAVDCRSTDCRGERKFAIAELAAFYKAATVGDARDAAQLHSRCRTLRNVPAALT